MLAQLSCQDPQGVKSLPRDRTTVCLISGCCADLSELRPHNTVSDFHLEPALRPEKQTEKQNKQHLILNKIDWCGALVIFPLENNVILQGGVFKTLCNCHCKRWNVALVDKSPDSVLWCISHRAEAFTNGAILGKGTFCTRLQYLNQLMASHPM